MQTAKQISLMRSPSDERIPELFPAYSVALSAPFDVGIEFAFEVTDLSPAYVADKGTEVAAMHVDDAP